MMRLNCVVSEQFWEFSGENRWYSFDDFPVDFQSILSLGPNCPPAPGPRPHGGKWNTPESHPAAREPHAKHVAQRPRETKGPHCRGGPGHPSGQSRSPQGPLGSLEPQGRMSTSGGISAPFVVHGLGRKSRMPIWDSRPNRVGCRTSRYKARLRSGSHVQTEMGGEFLARGIEIPTQKPGFRSWIHAQNEMCG